MYENDAVALSCWLISQFSQIHILLCTTGWVEDFANHLKHLTTILTTQTEIERNWPKNHQIVQYKEDYPHPYNTKIFFLLLIIIMASISWGLTWIFRIIGSVSPPVKSWHFLRLIHSGAAMDMSYFFLIFHDSNLSPASIILENIWAWSERKYFPNFASEAAANVSVVHLQQLQTLSTFWK